ncbi:hypothetical protein BdWA1_002865 [Babesia duncani]|uniref:Uncharacterized protein n=1 Tax=Babesia duncani TaxID=323732 RepID=A0AAD9UMY5_9APIC|nr:hypothetical protein BdWA1_002865 [Babesia duncani]
MNFRWFLGLVVVGLTNIKNVVSFPFNDSTKAITFHKELIQSVDDSVKSRKRETVLEFLDILYEKIFIGTVNEDAVIRGLLDEEYLTQCPELPDVLEEYRYLLLKGLEGDKQYTTFIRMDITRGSWDIKYYQTSKSREEGKTAKPENARNIIEVFEKIHSCIGQLEKVDLTRFPQEPLSITIRILNNYIISTEESMNEMNQLEFIRKHPNLSIALKDLLKDHIIHLRLYKAILETDQGAIMSMGGIKKSTLVKKLEKQSTIMKEAKVRLQIKRDLERKFLKKNMNKLSKFRFTLDVLYFIETSFILYMLIQLGPSSSLITYPAISYASHWLLRRDWDTFRQVRRLGLFFY